MSIQQYNVYEGLTSARLVSSANIVGSYNNGNLNNGIGAFLDIPSSVFSIDLRQVNVGDSIVLMAQTNQNENGIYVCIQTGDIFNFSIIQRRPDFHSVDQLRAGQYISIGDGAINSGSIFTVTNPLPNIIGIDPINFNGSNASIKKVVIDVSDTSVLQPGGIPGFMGVIETTTVPLNSATSGLIGTYGKVVLDGIVQGIVAGILGQVVIMNQAINGGFNLSAALVGILDLTTATINGATITPCFLSFGQLIGTATDLSNVRGQIIENDTGRIIESLFLVTGDANYLLETKNANAYNLPAGIGAGQAGDPSGCNAQIVLKVKINGTDIFIPGFTSN